MNEIGLFLPYQTLTQRAGKEFLLLSVMGHIDAKRRLDASMG